MKRILIYDDDTEILFLCSEILRKYGYESKSISRCDSIMEDITSFDPHLVLMDLWIPTMGGEQAVKLLKENSHFKQPPVFLFSANADIKTICTKINADGYIQKPFTVQEFVASIEQGVNLI